MRSSQVLPALFRFLPAQPVFCQVARCGRIPSAVRAGASWKTDPDTAVARFQLDAPEEQKAPQELTGGCRQIHEILKANGSVPGPGAGPSPRDTNSAVTIKLEDFGKAWGWWEATQRQRSHRGILAERITITAVGNGQPSPRQNRESGKNPLMR